MPLVSGIEESHKIERVDECDFAHVPNDGFAAKNLGVTVTRLRSVSSITFFVLRCSEHFVR